MSEEKDNNNSNSPNEEEIKKEEVTTEKTEEQAETETSKAKFTFKCTRCDKCCLARGPIPITLWDLELWARNGVVANFINPMVVLI
ncbi:MAG: hypothetical protein ACTSP6_11925 [Promethearchaeota archaeon]